MGSINILSRFRNRDKFRPDEPLEVKFLQVVVDFVFQFVYKVACLPFMNMDYKGEVFTVARYDIVNLLTFCAVYIESLCDDLHKSCEFLHYVTDTFLSHTVDSCFFVTVFSNAVLFNIRSTSR